MILFSDNVELRGIQFKTSAKGNTFYNVNVENKDGEAFKLYAQDDKGFEPNLKKGDIVKCCFEYNEKFKSLVLLEMQRVKNKVEG